MNKFKPCGNNVFVKRDCVNSKSSTLLAPVTGIPAKGEVVHSDAEDVEVGSVVYFLIISGEIEVNGEKLLVIKGENVIGIEK